MRTSGRGMGEVCWTRVVVFAVRGHWGKTVEESRGSGGYSVNTMPSHGAEYTMDTRSNAAGLRSLSAAVEIYNAECLTRET